MRYGNVEIKNRHKYLLQYHIIFVCKYRKKLLMSKQISDDIKQFSYEICQKLKIIIKYKLMEAMQEYGLREPEFRDMEIGFRINLYRNMEETRIGIDQDVQKVDQDIQKLTDDAVKISVYTEYNLTDKSKAVLALIKEQPDITERDCSSIGVEN